MISWDVESQQTTQTTPSTPALHEAKMACYFRHWPKPSSTFGEKVPVALDENFPNSCPTQVSIWEKWTCNRIEYISNSHLIYLVQLHYRVILFSVGDCLHWLRARGVWIWSQISGLPDHHAMKACLNFRHMVRPLEETFSLHNYDVLFSKLLTIRF